MKRSPLFIAFSLICVGGWIAALFFEIQLGFVFASVGHLGQAYFQFKGKNWFWKNNN